MTATLVLNRWLNRIYKSIAIMLVLFAVFISALRLFLPYAHNYRVEFQNYINATYQSQVAIGALSMDWQKDGPILVAKNVSLLNTDSTEIFIKNIDLHVDFWQSLKARRLITQDFTLAGAKVLVDKSQIAQGNVTEQDASLIDNISDLFLQQIGRFTLRDSQVVFQENNKQHTIFVEQLAWLNIDERHKAKGDVVFDGLATNNIKLSLDLSGQSLPEMNGQIYLQANNIDITPWLDRVLAIDDDKTDSKINFDAWLTIEWGVPKQFQLSYGENEISWQDQNDAQLVQLKSGQVIINNIDDINFTSLETSPLTFIVNNEPWQPISIYGNKQSNVYSGHINSVELGGINDLVPLFVNDKQILSMLDILALTGKVKDIFIKKISQDLQVAANFEQVSGHYSHGIPGIDNVSGELVYAKDKLNINFTANDGVLDFDKHFKRPLPYNTLMADVNVNLAEGNFSLTSSQVELNSDELTLTADVNVVKVDDAPIEMSLLATVKDVDAKNAAYYYPHLLMGEDLVSYLNASLIAGQIPQAQVLVNGPLASFPYKNGDGIFVVNGELEKAKFQFDPQWPEITEMSANLNFTNNGMLITARQGNLLGIEVSGVTAEIKDLESEQLLKIHNDIRPISPEVVANLMLQSPLKDTVGEVLTQVQISETIAGHFDLELPLKNIDEVVAQGKINFSNNRIALQSPEMNFEQVNGQLSFRNEIISVNNLSVNWRDLPLTVNVKAKDEQDYYNTNIQFSANWQDEHWKEQVPLLLKKYSNGVAAWQGDLSLYSHHDGGFSYNLDINSELYDLDLKLPEPYQKALYQNLPLKVNVSGQLNQSTITADVGEQLSFYGVLEHQSSHFSRAHLVLGDEKMLLPMDGFHITAKLDQAEFSQWQPFVLDIIDSIQLASDDYNTDQPLIAKPERIRGTVGQLDLFGQQLSNVSFNLLDKQAWWLLQLNAKEVRSQVKFYPDWYEQGVDIDADFIHFAKDGTRVVERTVAENSEQEIAETTKEFESLVDDDIIFANIPPMRLACASCRFGRVDFGEVNFEIIRNDSSVIDLKRFTAKRGKSKLNLEGFWLHDQNGSKTEFSGSLTAKDVEQEIEKLGYASIVKDSGIKTTFDIDWLGGPHDFAVESLNGKISSELDDGYLADVSDKGTRIFSVLSLQSIVRKLTLDFRDIFSDGMFYSSIKGDFDIKDGVLYTKNTQMKGAAGDLTIKGNTDLSQGQLDYRMSYRPDLTSSLPVLAWIAGTNPAIALAGMALDEIFISKVVSELKFELTGSLKEPNLVQVDRKSKNVSVGRSSPPQIVENSTIDNKVNKPVPMKPLPSGTLPSGKNKEKSPDNTDG